jgi:transposase
MSAAAAPAADRPHHPRALRPAAGPGRRGGRPPKVDPTRYRQRNVVERAIARLKQHRAIATRYDKLAVSYHSWLVLAALLLWLPA